MSSNASPTKTTRLQCHCNISGEGGTAIELSYRRGEGLGHRIAAFSRQPDGWEMTVQQAQQPGPPNNLEHWESLHAARSAAAVSSACLVPLLGKMFSPVDLIHICNE